MRDAAVVLSDAIRLEGFDAQTSWCELIEPLGRAERRRRLTEWLAQLRAEIEFGDVAAVLFHYSAWAGPRGIPIHAPRVARTLVSSSAPVVGFLHELAHPFGGRGWHGVTHAIPQRIALVPVVRACSAIVVTTEARAAWLRSRRWLPKRRTRIVPVFSNLPSAQAEARLEDTAMSIGIFGFAAPGIDVLAVGEVLRLVGQANRRVELVLIGAPGPDSKSAAEWLRFCSPHVVALRFTGIRTATEIARELANVDIVLFADRDGASAHRGTLAAALAAARPVVAVEGPEQWTRLIAEKAVVAVPATPPALAAALTAFMADAGSRREQGRRAERFYRTRMAPSVAARTISSILRELDGAAKASTFAGVA